MNEEAISIYKCHYSNLACNDIQSKNELFPSMLVKHLRDFDFDIEQYLKAPEEVIAKAIALVPAGADETDIYDYLHFLFIKRINSFIEWVPAPEPILCGDVIRLYYQGEEYNAVIRCDKKTMEVILVDDKVPLQHTATLPDSTDDSFTDQTGECCSAYGFLKAKEIIFALVVEKRYLYSSMSA